MDLPLQLVPTVTALLLRTVTGELTEPQCYEPAENFIINFMILNAWKLLKIMVKYPFLCLTLSSTPKCNFFGRHFFIRKMKMADPLEHVLSKVVKNAVLHHKTFEVMFYRQQISLWYHFSNFEHFLRTELLMTSLLLRGSASQWDIMYLLTGRANVWSEVLLDLLYNGERMGMVDKGIPEICLFQSNGINYFCPTVACNVKHADPQINSVRGVLNKFTGWPVVPQGSLRLEPVFIILNNAKQVNCNDWVLMSPLVNAQQKSLIHFHF